MNDSDLPNVNDVPSNSPKYRGFLLNSWELIQRLACEHGEMAYNILESLALSEIEEIADENNIHGLDKKVDEFDEIGRRIQTAAVEFLDAMEREGISPEPREKYSHYLLN